MGRHNKPNHTLRNVAVVASTMVGLATIGIGSASADPGEHSACTDRYSNPDINVCRDGHWDYDRLHALVRLDPVLCAHAVVDLDGRRRLIGTEDCDGRHRRPLVEKPCPPGTVTPAPSPAPVSNEPAPVVVPVTPVSEAPTGVTPVVVAPAPVIVNSGPDQSVPVVTH